MLSRLTIVQKLTLSTLFFFCNIIGLAYVYTESIGANITFAQQEMRGDEYQKTLMPLLYNINQLETLHRAGQDSAAMTAKIDADFKAVNDVQATIGEALQFTDQGLSSRGRSHLMPEIVKKKWTELKTASQMPFGDKSDEAYKSLLADIRGMIAHVGDMSNLSLDPDLDSYYLMDTTLVVLPQTIDRMSQVLASLEGKVILSPDELTDMAINARLFSEADMGRIAGDFDTAYKEDANFYGISPTFKTGTEGALKDYVSKNEQMIAALISLSKTGNPEEITNVEKLLVASQASADKLWKLADDELDTLLQLRINDYEGQKSSTLIKCLIGLLIAVGFFVIVIRDIVRPLKHIQDSMGALTSGNINHPIPHTQRKDEVGKMAAELQIFQKGLIEKEELKIQQEQERIKNEQLKRATMKALASKFEGSVQSIIHKVASAATQLYQTSHSLTQIIGNTSTRAKSVSTNSTHASNSVQTVAAAVEEMSASATEIAKQISQSVAVVKQTVTEVDDAEATSSMLAEANSKIGDIIQLIQNIASQINLLALNATIESARAGDAGKGFAVVANEVKNLANQTSIATEDIAQQIEHIQDVSKQVIRVFAAIKTSIGKVDHYSSSVAAAAEEQTAATNEISSSMASASQGTSQISLDINEVMTSSSEASVAASQVQDAAKMLSEEAERLNAEVGKFLIDLAS